MARDNDTADETVTDTTEQKPRTDLNFLGLCGTPIKDLEVKVTIDGQAYFKKTDARGCVPALNAEPGVPIVVEVKRLDGSFKTVDECTSGHTDNCKTYTSPAILLEATTELHVGVAGDIEQSIPQFEDADKGVVQAENTEPPVSEPYREEGYSHPKYVVAPTPSKSAPQTKKLPEPSRATAPKTGDQAPLKSGRDENGNPLMVYMEKVKDWWGRWHFWGVANSSLLGASTPNSSPTSSVTYSGSMQNQVQALIDFATEQISYDYAKAEGTQVIYTQMRNGTFKHKNGERETSPRYGRCYQWVRLALARVAITDGFLADEKDAIRSEQESASMAGGPLLRKGFKDVTSELPDARWGAAGDVIVYTWTPETWAERKKNKNRSDLPNFGHIDIRSYDAYISDFIPAAKHPGWNEYTDIRIYRKVFDPLPTARIRAFLHCLREYECQTERDESKRYGVLNYPLPSGQKEFSNYKMHPWQGVPIPVEIQLGKGSTAAGAYQIVYGTWEELFNKKFISVAPGADLFSPVVQDRLAVVLLEITNNALPLVRTGKTEDAVRGLTGRWSSLPGGIHNASRRTSEGKPMDMAYFMSLYGQYLMEEKAKEQIR